MATRYADALPRDLRFEPTGKRVRAELGGATAVDTTRAVLVWEPEKVVPGYAVPREDLAAEPPAGAMREYDDPDLAGYVGLRWDAFDRWLEEDEEVVGHPRDPFKRIDIRRSSRHVTVEVDGQVVAETHRPTLLFETGLPTRYYLPREDVRMDLLSPSGRRTTCAYKGQADHFSLPGDDHIAWTYPNPLPDHDPIRDLICFYNERVDITVDGEPAERPRTQWS